MAAAKMFVDAARTRGDLAGVFEYDGESAYFYLYDMTREQTRRVLGAIHVLSGAPDFDEDDVVVCWSREEDKVGLFIHGQLWAVFDGQHKLGGDYEPGGHPAIPAPEKMGFALRT